MMEVYIVYIDVCVCVYIYIYVCVCVTLDGGHTLWRICNPDEDRGEIVIRFYKCRQYCEKAIANEACGML